jgi:hypothetical protein
MMLFSPRWLFLVPGLLAMACGLIVGGWIEIAPRRVFGVGLDIHTMLYAASAVLVGFQAISFAVFTKVFAVAEGLLPPDPRLDRLFNYVTLETGLITGLTLLLAGLIATGAALFKWRAAGFGPLEPVRIARLVIPATLALTLGFSVVMNSFFLSVLGLRVRRLNPQSGEETL